MASSTQGTSLERRQDDSTPGSQEQMPQSVDKKNLGENLFIRKLFKSIRGTNTAEEKIRNYLTKDGIPPPYPTIL